MTYMYRTFMMTTMLDYSTLVFFVKQHLDELEHPALIT